MKKKNSYQRGCNLKLARATQMIKKIKIKKLRKASRNQISNKEETKIMTQFRKKKINVS